MKIFYNTSIQALKKKDQLEIADDIEDYVSFIEHEKNVLVYTLNKANTIDGNILLKRFGYNI